MIFRDSMSRMGSSHTILAEPARRSVALPRVALVSAWVVLAVGCVNLTPPWVTATNDASDGTPVLPGSGGAGGMGGAGAVVGGAAGFIDSVWGPGLDGGGASGPGVVDGGGTGGALASTSGTGGRDAATALGTGGSMLDATVAASGGAAGGLVPTGLGGFGGASDDGGAGGATGSSKEAPDAARAGDGNTDEQAVDVGTGFESDATDAQAPATIDGAAEIGPDLAADLPPAIPTHGLVAYYACENAVSGTLVDESGFGSDATLSGDTAFAPGHVGSALVLTAKNGGDAGHSGVYAALPAGILAGATGMTVAAWFNMTSTAGFQRIFDFGTSSDISSMYFTPANGSGVPQFTIRQVTDGPDIKQTLLGPELETNVWHFVVAVLDASSMRLYLDGVEVASTNTVKLTTLDLGAMPNNWIGRSEFPADPYFDGMIDEFRVYDRALSADEAAALFNAR